MKVSSLFETTFQCHWSLAFEARETGSDVWTARAVVARCVQTHTWSSESQIQPNFNKTNNSKKKENLTEVRTNSSVYEHKRVCRCFFFLTKETLEFAQDKMETTEKRKTVQRTGEETSKMKTGRSGIVWLLLIPVEVWCSLLGLDGSCLNLAHRTCQSCTRLGRLAPNEWDVSQDESECDPWKTVFVYQYAFWSERRARFSKWIRIKTYIPSKQRLAQLVGNGNKEHSCRSGHHIGRGLHRTEYHR